MSQSPAVLGTLMPGFSGTELPDWVADRLRAGMAGVCLFGPNIESADQLRALTAAIRDCNPAALIAVDEEGGDVTRLHFHHGSPLPGSAWLGRLDDESRTHEVGAMIADELRAAGCNVNFAPCADVNTDPRNPVIGVRSFGADPELAARHTSAWIRGHQARGVAACVKHFPGHGDTAVDSHHALPVLDADMDRLDAQELPPFRAAFDAGAWGLMTSHILLPRLDGSGPATFSTTVLGDLLRDRLRFDGAVVSDALDMAGASAKIGIPEAAVRAVAGGCDLLCLGWETPQKRLEDIEGALLDAVDQGRLPEERVADAVRRAMLLASRVTAPVADAPPGRPFTESEAAEVFDVSAGVARLLAESPGAEGWRVVCLETTPNMAAGLAPWGPGAAQRSGVTWPGGIVELREDEATELSDRLAGAAGAVIVARSSHRHPWVRSLVDASRAQRPTVAVDMGWPSDDRAYADIATFGASRLLGAALLQLLGALTREGGRAA